MVPVRESSRSARVDLPWSMCATIEKLRISSVGIVERIARLASRSGRNARVRGHFRARGDDRAGPERAARADAHAGADDAVHEPGVGPYRDVLPEDRTLDHRALAHRAALAED